MAARRMFSKNVARTDAFLDMSQSAQNLYFHLGIDADDDGFVSPKMVMRMLGSTTDDLKILVAKSFVIPFEDGVVVIRHWRVNNEIRQDRYKETQYTDHKDKLSVVKGIYDFADAVLPLVVPTGDNLDTQVRLGKVRLGKVSSGELQAPKEPPPPKREASISYVENLDREEIQRLSAKYVINEGDIRAVASRLVLYCGSKGRRYKNYKLALENWIARDFKLRDTSNSKYAKYS